MNDLETIKARNARVEADKAWETSWFRRAVIAVGTYAVVGLYLKTLGVEQAWYHAAVPAGAYLISTLGLRLLKGVWISHFYKQQGPLS